MRRDFLVQSIKNGIVNSWEVSVIDEEEAKATIEAEDEEVIRVADADNFHFCQHCNNMVEGNFKDLLCNSCRELFGHSLFSEL